MELAISRAYRKTVKLDGSQKYTFYTRQALVINGQCSDTAQCDNDPYECGSQSAAVHILE